MKKIIRVSLGYIMAVVLIVVAIPFMLVSLFLGKSTNLKYKGWLQDISLPLVYKVERLVNS